ncbi:LrgB-like family-domain-containing protein [Dipodascopsis tothii]|uniref:LrgB-like family-domain-containing protein n=1 Tax=Dipodascopsis tothii TaxID=44089 RepID=UPI0034CFC5E2
MAPSTRASTRASTPGTAAAAVAVAVAGTGASTDKLPPAVADADGLGDALDALRLIAAENGPKLATEFVVVPVGLAAVLVVMYWINYGLVAAGVNFPASVICLFVLFGSLLLCETVLGTRRTSAVIRVINVPLGFALRWITLMFTPSFVVLPLSPAVSGAEVGKIAAVFIVGFVAMMTACVYTVMALQKVLGVSKRAVVQRVEELPPYEDEDFYAATPATSRRVSLEAETIELTELPARPEPEPTRQPSARAKRVAALVSRHFDVGLHVLIFLTVGLPVLYTTGYTLVAHMTLSALTLYLGMAFPPRVRRVLHPLFTCSGLTILGIYLLALTRGQTLTDGLDAYNTGRVYTALADAEYAGVLPGAGDVLKSMLHVSIVSLALPMFTYRADLRQYFLLLMIPNLLAGVVSFFAYPPICYAIGISATRSLAFVSRSVTLALASPLVMSLGGSQSLAAVTAVLSGVVGVLVGKQILRALKVREDDYLTIGITLGVNSSAIAAADLLTYDPRAGALAVLSFVVYGTSMVIFAAIPPMAAVLRGWVGL